MFQEQNLQRISMDFNMSADPEELTLLDFSLSWASWLPSKVEATRHLDPRNTQKPPDFCCWDSIKYSYVAKDAKSTSPKWHKMTSLTLLGYLWIMSWYIMIYIMIYDISWWLSELWWVVMSSVLKNAKCPVVFGSSGSVPVKHSGKMRRQRNGRRCRTRREGGGRRRASAGNAFTASGT